MLADKLTKIVATIGPASESEEMIKKLIHAGVNIFRFNFKHNTVEWHADRVKRVKKVAKEINATVGVLLDLQGPTIRIVMSSDDISIKKGDLILFGDEALKEGVKGFSTTHPDIIKYLKNGQKLLADDGTFTFFIEKKGGKCYVRSETTGILKNRKALNIPGADFPLPVLTERDHEGLRIVAKEGVDIIALSFVRSAQDIKDVKEAMKKYKINAKINSKIETKSGIDNIDEIIDETDSLMVARGDLGVEIPMEEVPYCQKMMIRKCLEKGKPVITATQMLQSMITNPIPTRAEVSDVANATYDNTDAVMLSAESATGQFPLQAVEIMSKALKFNEVKFPQDTRKVINFKLDNQEAMICDAAYNLYIQDLPLKHQIVGFLVFTHSGKTANCLSRYHPDVPIFTFSSSEKVRDSLTLNFGVKSFQRVDAFDYKSPSKDMILRGIGFLKKNKLVKKSDKLIVLHGDVWAGKGGTSTIKIVIVE
jgi:pyruvate kinase